MAVSPVMQPPPSLPRTTTLPRMPPCHACPLPHTHTHTLPCMPPYHAHPLLCTSPLPCMPPCHKCPLPCMSSCPAMHTSPGGQNSCENITFLQLLLRTVTKMVYPEFPRRGAPTQEREAPNCYLANFY